MSVVQVLAAAFALMGPAHQQPAGCPPAAPAEVRAHRRFRRGLARELHRLHRAAGGRPPRERTHAPPRLPDCPRVRHRRFRALAARELHRLHDLVVREAARRMREEGYRSPRQAAWDCIHRHEGAWDANTGNGYHGGLQMDWSFMRAYGPEFVARWGGAENWPPWAQVRAADRAYEAGRGFGPWPNTAAACGLR